MPRACRGTFSLKQTDLKAGVDRTVQEGGGSLEHLSNLVIYSVPAGSPSRGEDVAVYVVDDIGQPSLPTPFYSFLVSISVFLVLSTVFHSINSPDNAPLSHSVLPVLFLPYWSFQLFISL